MLRQQPAMIVGGLRGFAGRSRTIRCRRIARPADDAAEDGERRRDQHGRRWGRATSAPMFIIDAAGEAPADVLLLSSATIDPQHSGRNRVRRLCRWRAVTDPSAVGADSTPPRLEAVVPSAAGAGRLRPSCGRAMLDVGSALSATRHHWASTRIITANQATCLPRRDPPASVRCASELTRWPGRCVAASSPELDRELKKDIQARTDWKVGRWRRSVRW